MKTILNIVKKEFLQFKRDPKMFGIILIAPVIQLIFLGYAVNMDVEKVKTVVYDQDRSNTSRYLLQKFSENRYFEFVEVVDNYNDFQIAIESGDASLGLVIPYNFEESIERTRTEYSRWG